jgi:hypothetical protein
MATPKVRYRIDLRDAFDKAFSSDGPVKRSMLRPLISDVEVRRQIGRDVIDRIIHRTKVMNVDKDDTGFPGYSRNYENSLKFEIYGKGDRVDLTLTGEMLSSMVQKTDSRFYIDVVMADKKNNDKAHGNITGNYGRDRYSEDNKGPKARDFLGLPESDLNKIVRRVVTKASSSRLDISIGILAEALASPNTSRVAITPTGKARNIQELFAEGFEIE